MTRASDTAKLIGAGATILDGTTITTADNTSQLTLTSTDADASGGPLLTFYRNSASPADSDATGKINFHGENSAGEDTTYAQIFTSILDVTDGTEDGRFKIGTLLAGSFDSRLDMTNTETVFNEDSKDLDFRVEGNGDTHALFVQGSDDKVGINNSSPVEMLTIGTTSDAASRIQFLSATNGVNTIHFGDGTSTSAYAGYINYAHDSDSLQFATSASERARIDDGGNVYLNITSNPVSQGGTTTAGQFFGANSYSAFARVGGVVAYFNRQHSDGDVIGIRQDGSDEGFISVSGSTVSYGSFSGAHWSRLTDNSKPTILRGTIIETIDEMCDWYQAKITIPKTDDNDERIIKDSIALPEGKKVGDTISHTYEDVTYDNAVIVKEDDDKHTKCKISDTADSTRVYGVYTSWDNDDDTVNDMHVTACGTHVVRINKDVTVSAGNLLSSNGDGTAKVQDDDIIRSKTIGKVLTNIKQETYSDGSYIVPCALYCG